MAHHTQSSSRILRVSPLSAYTLEFLALPLVVSPSMIWCLRSYEIDALWLFFESSTLARQALELYSQSIPVSAAVESELEPLAKLERFDASQHVVSLP
ncbi:hypothetical protein BDV98DRAFT_281741 [Pterulicium gracile]|uniref:Uncharacterized protein n=1 Tax=Pterulicium gracile TaxID=1884261 RepID=A0A5C3QUG2_9AGAR|nr:hypothetical protein BDV98DRAFT_281741 [Pterula gracilis]